ncbi:kinase-like protein [Gigaspora margarita]|uniref:Kinase-like protein n=1 Tax=Gigaspora margarita TaxID=4874 RepID=A0A8H3XI69_GIGMA|nr:kinase-like protein [Gigaspora margarita]
MIYSEEWLKNAIDEGYIKSYDYSEFSVHKPIGQGAFGIVYKAKWKDYGLTIALKQLNIISMEEKTIQRFAKELKNLRKVCEHPNIIKFYGVTRDRGFYNMVLQLANNGDLREYLKINFSKLEWTDKLRMAREISDGLEFLHKNDIIHRDLHSKNILVHEGKLMIADFGFSKDETSKTSNASVHGMQAYIDPQCFKSESYRRSKKSDIYSLGVILWEISSGRPPFQSLAKIPYGIIFHVSEGGREIPIEDTPSSYIQLYKRCWNYDPNQRPELEEISRKLMDLSENENFGTSKFDEFISDTTSKISNSDIPLSTNSNNDYEKILEPLKFIDDLFMEHFLNAGAGVWELQSRSRDVGERGVGLFIPILGCPGLCDAMSSVFRNFSDVHQNFTSSQLYS